ncbi:unnamed protein product [Leptosia nina]|uniref:Akirin n=1 Tax=Leptosia nina TaxID=320188 RepID=A0AAV1JVB1_9NEOP
MACATLKRNLEWDAQMPTKRRRCAPLAASSSTSPGIKIKPTSSVFGEAVSASVQFTPEHMDQEIFDAIERLKRRGQLRVASGTTASSSSGSEGDASPPHNSSRPYAQARRLHQSPLFTFKQLRMICQRMLREQEAALRAEYETALSNKLAEQYEAFVRFNIDQVQRRPPPTTCMQLGMDAEHHMSQDLVPSYLS